MIQKTKNPAAKPRAQARNLGNTKTDHQPAFLKVLAGEAQHIPPAWLMRQAGRYLPEYREVRAKAGTFLDLCYNPALAMEVTLQPILRFGFDASIIFSDILVIPHALGQHVEFVEGEGPRLTPVDTAEKLAKLSATHAPSRLAPVFEAIERTVAALGDATPLIGFCGAPWTVASYMVGGQGSPDQRAAKLLAYREPALFSAMLDLLVETSIEYLSHQVKAGARALQIFDSWAGSLSDYDFRRFSIEPTARIVAGVRAVHPLIPIIGFPRLSAASYAVYVKETGVSALGCDTAAPLQTMAAMQNVCPVQGNLDPLLLMAGGDAMQRRVHETIESLGRKPFIFNLGHGILPETPIPHVEQLLAEIRRPTS